jgi:hypothetical protein
MEMIDNTGLPQTDIAIERALTAVKNRLCRSDLPANKDIELFLELFTIKDCLEELLQLRKSFGASNG